MSSALGAIQDVAQRGWTWWSGEMRSMLPGFCSNGTKTSPVSIAVVVDPDDALRILGEGRTARKLRRAKTQEQLEDALAKMGRSRPGTKVRLGLPPGAVLERAIEMPSSARAQAGAMLALDLERSTPFKLGDVYAAHVLAPSSRKGWLAATQFVAKRKTVEEARARIESFGLKVEGIDCLETDQKTLRNLNLLEPSAGVGRTGSHRKWPQRLVALTALALVAGSVFMAISRRETALSQLEEAVAAARLKAEGVRREESIAEAKRRQRFAMRSLKTARPMAVEIIDELTRLLPDDVVLNELKIEAGTIDFSGLTKSAAAVVAVLERSSMFHDVELTAPVALDASSDKERLSLRAKLRLPTKSASADAEVAQ